MARTTGPLFSLDARKTLGKTITFTHWKGRTTVRKRVIPKNPKSGLQVGMRSGLRFNSQRYATLTTTQKNDWIANGKGKKITGLQAMQRFNQPRLRRNLGVVSDPLNAAGAAEAAPTAVAATAAPKSVNLTWVDSAGANDYCTFIYMSTTTGFTPDLSNLLRVVPHGVQAFTATKLTTGTAYYFVLKGCETGGTLGTAAAQVTATPT